jgi:hypothetical protein
MDNNYLDTEKAAERLSMSTSYLAKLRCLSTNGPLFKKFGRSVRYRPEDLDAWAAARTHKSTSDTNPGRGARKSRQAVRASSKGSHPGRRSGGYSSSAAHA